MRLYVDAMFFQATGLGRVIDGALETLLAEVWVESVESAVPSRFAAELRDRFASRKLSVHAVPWEPMSVGDLIGKRRLLRRIADRVDLFYFPSHNVPLAAPRPFVLSVNDTTPFSPDFRIDPLRRAGFAWLLRRSVARAVRVMTLSESVRRELLDAPLRVSAPIDVVPARVASCFFLDPAAPRPWSRPAPGPPASARWRLLFVGARFAHKNLRALLEAFAILAPERIDLELVIAGPRRERIDDVDRWRARSARSASSASTDYGDRVIEREGVTDDQLAELLARSDLLVFPSLAEGFGLPPLEAMAAGVPVVCSDLPVLRETCGDAAEFANARDPADLARAIRRLLDDEERRRALIDAGRRRAAQFSAAEVAERFLRVARSWADSFAAPERSRAQRGS